MPPSHNPLFLGTPASCLLLSLRLDATEGESALGRAFCVYVGGGRVGVLLMRSVSHGSLLGSTLLFAESKGELLCLQL